jgi:hypothetical protein
MFNQMEEELWNAKPFGYDDKINSICNGEYTIQLSIILKNLQVGVYSIT